MGVSQSALANALTLVVFVAFSFACRQWVCYSLRVSKKPPKIPLAIIACSKWKYWVKNTQSVVLKTDYKYF